MVKVTLIKSLIGTKPKQKATAESLGLHKIGDYTVQKKCAALDGKITIVSHLVKVEEA